MQQATDTEILALLGKDLDRGGRLLFNRYYKPLVVFADSYITDPDTAEDLVQDVFYHFVKNETWNKIEPRVLSTYLFRSVRNACINHLEQQKIVIPENELLRFDAIEEVAPTVDSELIDKLMDALDHLPERAGLVVRKVVLESKKYKEVAEELSISVNTVKSLLSAGLGRLREQFPKEFLVLLLLAGGYLPAFSAPSRTGL
ncbi:MAG: sigma-70 family RNA polymerase sigma factor [Odoribacter sp.]|nr:sigma-70 family RNA polymerase sigma factor [Odoribacter sp.]